MIEINNNFLGYLYDGSEQAGEGGGEESGEESGRQGQGGGGETGSMSMRMRMIREDNVKEIDEPKARGPKGLNFPDGNFQRAKTFQKKCVNRFRDKKVRKSFLRQKSMRKFFL